jgi:hypothetical protein
MSLRIVNETLGLFALANYTARKAQWLKKLARNQKPLAKLSSLVVVDPTSLEPVPDGTPNRIVLNYIGKGVSPETANNDLGKIQGLLDCEFDFHYVATNVRIGRLKASVVLNVPWFDRAA